MVDAICNKLTSKIRKKMPEIDDERAEVINYGLQLIIGEIPKTLIILLIAWIFGVLELTILALIITTPYRITSGGVHLKTHLGCMIATSLFYIGNAFISKNLVFDELTQYIVTSLVWIFAMWMITLYAPADTEAVPILRKKERKIKKILSYIILSISLVIALLINNTTISNILLFGMLFQTITITRFMYQITSNKYGHETYVENNEESS